MKAKVYENMRFGNLTTIKRVDNIGKRISWLCKCDCGKEIVVKACNLYRKDSPTTSCGCTYSNVFEDLTGRKFGKFIVLKRDNSIKDKTIWECKCDCGNIARVDRRNLISGNTSSCGCLIHEIQGGNTKHGMRETRLYSTWNNMKNRCKDKSNKSYGGKGISVCKEWEIPENFFSWALSNGYNDNLSIDRIDNSKGYSPDNCRWADSMTQANNISRNVVIEHNGETHTLAEWSRIYNVPYKQFQRKIRKYGMTIDEAVSDLRRKTK